MSAWLTNIYMYDLEVKCDNQCPKKDKSPDHAKIRHSPRPKACSNMFSLFHLDVRMNGIDEVRKKCIYKENIQYMCSLTLQKFRTDVAT